MKPNQGIDLREYELETDITDGNRAIHSSEWMETDLHKSQPELSLLRKRATLLKRNDYFGKSRISAKVKENATFGKQNRTPPWKQSTSVRSDQKLGRREEGFLETRNQQSVTHSSEWVVVTTTRQPPAEAGKGADIPPG